MTEVWLCESTRTPIGRYAGALSGVRADDLAAHVIREVVAKSGVNVEAIDEVILGCANQAG
ncbi:MAG: 3-oxoadipyl-CoA thiolase, partial [Gammaproteobacteria bacterium]|nr:3-oxoadipyl-CoA thiolase [Gammaproteobacteria bacterium]